MLLLQINLTRDQMCQLLPFIRDLKATHNLLIEIREGEDTPFYGNDKIKLFMLSFLKYAFFDRLDRVNV